MIKERIYSRSISQHINGPYREYALYTLENRGIPNFYDGLTNVQRLILLNAPTKFTKTVGVIGSVMSTGHYHHGDKALIDAVAKLARPFAVSRRILDGSGFFGNEVSPEAAAPRYTEVKLSSEIKKLLDQNESLNIANADGYISRLHVELPICLLTHTIGIAVGYATNILPRNFDDIKDYLDGKRTSLDVYFQNFNGTVEKIENSWIIRGDIRVDKAKKEIHIKQLPPILKYKTFLEKLSKISDKYFFRIIQNSTKTIDIKLIAGTNFTAEDFDKFVEIIQKATSIGFTENVTLIKDGRVVQYSCVEDYLDDFKEIVFDVRIKKFQQTFNSNAVELNYLDWKYKFMKWLLETKRDWSEIKQWISAAPSEVSSRLNRITIKEQVPETLDEIQSEISKLNSANVDLQKEIKAIQKKFDTYKSKHVSKARVTQTKAVDFTELGIEEWQPDEQELEDPETIEN